MYETLRSPVQPVTFATALQVTLDNYYDLLKAEAGSLTANEFLQLKLVADIVDVTEKENKDGGYEWFSHYNLLKRADLAIEPKPISDMASVGLIEFSKVYGKFLQKLSRFVIKKALTPDEQKQKSALDAEIEAIKTQLDTLSDKDYANWIKYCQTHSLNPADTGRYAQWSSSAAGHGVKILELHELITDKEFEVYQLLDKQYSDPGDKDIITALTTYRRASMSLCFPVVEDYKYLPTVISLGYLAGIYPPVKSGLYDVKYFTSFNPGIDNIRKTLGGSLNASFNKSTNISNSITTDWGASASVGYGFISAKASASEHKEIQEDFNTATEITLKSKASFRVNINFGGWFDASLFKSKYIKQNPLAFMDFFGKDGTLLYYPTALIVIRGFSVEFKNSQQWTYDYKKSFNASAGGGFGIFGISFGASYNYGSNIREHTVDQAATSLKISDDDNTFRFVGYAVAKNELLSEDLSKNFETLIKNAK
jgi:hypothetical protein